MSDEMSGSALVKVIVPVMLVISIVSEPLLIPAAHSPGVDPEAVLLFAAVIASRKVHKPSALLTTSDVLLTAIVLPWGIIMLLFGSQSFAHALPASSQLRLRQKPERMVLRLREIKRWQGSAMFD